MISKIDPKHNSVGNATDPMPVDFDSGNLIGGGTISRDHTQVDTDFEVIVDRDDRVEVTESVSPYRCICLLVIADKNNNRYYGTGFFVSPRCVITSGHCVYFRGDWARAIKIIPGAVGNHEPFGSAVSKKFRSVEGWTNDSDDDCDYAGILLDDDLLYNSVNSCLDYAFDVTNNMPIKISGYPSDKLRTQWQGEGTVKELTDRRIFYDVDTVKGNSGSPVLHTKQGKQIVVGVHSGGESINYSIRLRQQVIDRWNEWSSIVNP